MVRGSLERARAELAERLRERKGEIEEALLTRTYAIADPKEAANPEYAQGLRAAVAAALDYGLAVVEHGEERAPQVPVLLLAQARLAARNGVPLDTVLRRYFAGYTLLGDFIVQEAGAASLRESWLKRLLRDQAALFDRFLVTVTEEYGHEGRAGLVSTEQKQAERIERLLAGELIDPTELSYGFDAHHTGLIARGPSVAKEIRELAVTLGDRLLLIHPEEGTAWAWLGSRAAPNVDDIIAHLSKAELAETSLAIGESAPGLAGWRLTHRQASAAFLVVLRRPDSIARYADVALLASVIPNDLLVTSLHELYLAPLQRERDGGKTIRGTLRAYFSAGRNVSSAAAALGVNRNTVASRLRAVEALIGRHLSLCSVEFEVALRLEELETASHKSARR